MWHLQPATPESGDAAALPLAGHDPTYSIGRRECDIILKDKAVSKRHAELELHGDELYVRDVGSKFGTAVNGQRLEPNLARELLDGDEVSLGSSVLSVRKRPLVLCVSGMADTAAKALGDQVAAVGASVSREFRPNTSHLVMPTVKLTPKLLLALAHACPVVSPVWVEKLLRRSSASEPLPSLIDAECEPPLDTAAKTQLPVDVHRVRPERTRLFASKRFVWLPGGRSTTPPAETTRLLRAMDAEAVLPWPAEAPEVEMEAFVSQKVAEGYMFLLPNGTDVQESKAVACVVRAGGLIFSEAAPRVCLLHASVESGEPMPLKSRETPVVPGLDSTLPATQDAAETGAPAADLRPTTPSPAGAGERVARDGRSRETMRTSSAENASAGAGSLVAGSRDEASSNSGATNIAGQQRMPGSTLTDAPALSRASACDSTGAAAPLATTAECTAAAAADKAAAVATVKTSAHAADAHASAAQDPATFQGWRRRIRAGEGGTRDESEAMTIAAHDAAEDDPSLSQPRRELTASDRKRFRKSRVRRPRAAGCVVMLVEETLRSGLDDRDDYDQQINEQVLDANDELFDGPTLARPHQRRRR